MRFLPFFALLFATVFAKDRIIFVEKGDYGILLKNNSNEMTFMYMPCSLNFRIISDIDNPLDEKEDKHSKYENHKQAAISKSHGFFLNAGEGFIIDYPPGYTMKTFPKGVILRLHYRSVKSVDKDGLLLSGSETTEVNLDSSRVQKSEETHSIKK